jgi:DNA-directed RNA polymerase subunit RPC12/RpoP
MTEAAMKKKMVASIKCTCCGEQLTLASFRKHDQWWVCWRQEESKIVDLQVVCKSCRYKLHVTGRLMFDLELGYFSGFRSVVRQAEYLDRTTPQTRQVLLDLCFNAQALPTDYRDL